MSTARTSSPALSTSAANANSTTSTTNDVPVDDSAAATLAIVPTNGTGNGGVDDDEEIIDVPDNSDELANTDDGSKDAQDPHAYIERSLRYSDLCLCRDQAVERVKHLIKFEKTMPASKRPSNGKNGGCLTQFQDKVNKAQKRVDDFRTDYASKRVIAKTKRTERLARDKLAKSHQDSLGKPMLDDLSKRFKIAKILAAKAAAEAIRALGAEATKEAKKDAAETAFNDAAAAAMKSDAVLPNMEALAEMAASASSEMDDADIPDAGAGAAVAVA